MVRRLIISTAIAGVLALPGSASAAATCSGAIRGAEHTRAYALNEAGHFRCRFTGPSRFNIAFRPVHGPSWELTVWYTHRHYIVGLPRFG